jgi:hypothetical protein
MNVGIAVMVRNRSVNIYTSFFEILFKRLYSRLNGYTLKICGDADLVLAGSAIQIPFFSVWDGREERSYYHISTC